MRRAYRLAYDGTGYRGYQRQPHAETVENALFRALAALDVVRTADTPPDGYAAAGRTDAGVSAFRQTVSFDAPAWLTPRALNAELPTDVRAWASADAPDDFHAQHDATSRTYEYHLYAPRVADQREATDRPRVGDRPPRREPAAQPPEGPWSMDQVSRAAAVLDRLSGRHDFHNLTPDDTGTERNLVATGERAGDFLVCRFKAGGFPRSFVRRAVGLVTSVATGERDLGFVDRVLGTEPLDGPDGVAAAAPAPLVLRRVAYPLEFERDDAAAASARTVFGQRRVERLTGARVAARLRPDATDG
jgi:tRNA pseudouridine38-40 synthase